MTRSIQISLKPAAGVMLHLYRDDGMMANIQTPVLAIMPHTGFERKFGQ